ncbi:WD40 repeat domain-containing protein [Streptomyces venetus]|uniref:WD40 repeat domain-containing protein n=1 Tax=Streptomyces venetus TaxID=1701086 RepID=UPI003C2C0FFA
MAEERLLPSAVRELLHRLPPGTNEWDLCPRLTGESQSLWGFLSHCVAQEDEEALRLAMAGRTPLHDVLDEAAGYTRLEEPAEAPFVDRESAPARALRAYAALGLALIGDADAADGHLRTGASWLLRSASASTADEEAPDEERTGEERTGEEGTGEEAAEWSVPTGSPHAERLARLLAAGRTPAPVRAHLSLVLLALDGGLPKPLSGPRLTVLADRGNGGARFQLRLDLVRGLPAGLLPDPRSMSAFLGDERFRGSLDDAWRTARPAKLKGAVLWSLRDGDGPVDHVSDSSFGAAFAVLLKELGRTRGSLVGPLRLSRANPRTSVIGAVSAADPGVIESVAGYENKLSVVDDGDRVVVPKRDEKRARDLNSRAVVVGAVTVDEAAKVVRRLDTRATSRLVAGVLTIGLVTSLVAWGLASGENERINRRAQAAKLAAQAVRLKSSEPRRAGLLALAGYEIDPGNKEAKEAIQEVLETNRNTVRSWVADGTFVDVLAVDAAGRRAYTAGGDDTIRVWDTRSGRRLAEVKGGAAGLVRGDESGFLAAHDGRDVRLFDASDSKPEPMGTVKAPSCTGPYSKILGMDFTANGSALTTVWDDGAVAVIDPASRTTTGCVRIGDIAGKKIRALLRQGRTAISADVVAGSSAPGGRGDQAVLLLTTNDVVAVDLRTNKVSHVVPAAEVPGTASLVQASQDMVTLAMDDGVLAWDRAGRERIAYPVSGLSTRPAAMEQDGDDVVVAGPGGTAVLPVRPALGSVPEALSTPSGGRSVAAARADDGTVVAIGEARVTVLANAPVQRALPPTKPSTGAAFGPGNTLLLTDFMSNASYGAYTIDLDSEPDLVSAAGTSYDPVVDYPASAAYINALAMSDKFVAAVGQSRGLGAVTVWKRDGTYLEELLMSPEQDRGRKGEERIVAQVAFARKNRLLVARHVSGDVGIWSTGTWQRLGTIHLAPGTTAMAIHGRTGVFAEGEGEKTRLVMVDLVTRKRLRSVAAPDVVRLSVSADGSRLAALSYTDRTVRLLDGEKLTKLRSPLRLPAGELARDSAISPDGRLLATAMGDHVLVHNLKSGQQTMPPLRDTNGNVVVDVQWSANGAYLAGSTLPPERENKQPGVVNVWKVTEGSLKQRMCDWTDGGLSQDEWEKYVDESVPYIDLCKGVAG